MLADFMHINKRVWLISCSCKILQYEYDPKYEFQSDVLHYNYIPSILMSTFPTLSKLLKAFSLSVITLSVPCARL